MLRSNNSFNHLLKNIKLFFKLSIIKSEVERNQSSNRGNYYYKNKLFDAYYKYFC